MSDDPPCLQQLVLAYGTWDKIPPKAWQAFSAEMAEWKAKVRYGELGTPGHAWACPGMPRSLPASGARSSRPG